MPRRVGSDACNSAQRKWLSRGAVSFSAPDAEMLNMVLPLLGHDQVTDGLAAIRFWGQTGERSAAWMAAADPVYFETGMQDLRLHAFGQDDVVARELRDLFKDLQAALGGGKDGSLAFANVGTCGYLSGDPNLATAPVSADIADGQFADTFMPMGAGSESYQRLLSELQMSLHEHPLNDVRTGSGRQPINSLWIWGGGTAPEKDVRAIPPLFSDDPLYKGYWESCTGVTADWSGDFAECLLLALKGFVVVLPDVADEARPQLLDACLGQLRQLLKSGQISALSLLFWDGITVHLKRYDHLKFWQRIAPQLSTRTRND